MKPDNSAFECITIVLKDRDSRKRGIFFENPLYVNDSPAQAGNGFGDRFRLRDFIDNHAKCISIAIGFLSLILFLILPISLLTSLPISIIETRKTKSFIVLLYCGVCQPSLMYFIVSQKSRERLKTHYTFWKLLFLIALLFQSVEIKPSSIPTPEPFVKGVKPWKLFVA